MVRTRPGRVSGLLLAAAWDERAGRNVRETFKRIDVRQELHVAADISIRMNISPGERLAIGAAVGSFPFGMISALGGDDSEYKDKELDVALREMPIQATQSVSSRSMSGE